MDPNLLPAGTGSTGSPGTAMIVTSALLLLMGIFLLILGKHYSRNPGKINGLAGYRTTRTLESQEVWDKANMYFGKCMLVQGLVLSILSIIGLIASILTDCSVLTIVAVSVSGGYLLISLIVNVVLTEKYLNREFKEDNELKKPVAAN